MHGQTGIHAITQTATSATAARDVAAITSRLGSPAGLVPDSCAFGLLDIGLHEPSGSGTGSVAARHNTGICSTPVARTTMPPTIAPVVSRSPSCDVAVQIASS